MPTYRYLTDEELKYFEEELKQFLILNHVYNDEWVKLNSENPEKALELIGLFSDKILQRVYENMKYFEKRTKDACFVFFYDTDKIYLKVIQVEGEEPIDLSTTEGIHDALVNKFEELSFFKSSKKYSKGREIEIHHLLEQETIPSSSEFWEMLDKIIP